MQKGSFAGEWNQSMKICKWVLAHAILSLFLCFIAQASSIEGTLLMMDNKTPHVAVPIQVIQDGEVITTVLSDKSGKYQLLDLNPGKYKVRCQVSDGYVYYKSETEKDTPSLTVGNSNLKNIDFHFAPFKKGVWKNYTALNGLAHNRIRCIYGTSDGVVWFGTYGGGASRYDGIGFANFTIKDGLIHKDVNAIYRDPDGVIWFATVGGVSRYDGIKFEPLTTDDGLLHNYVTDVCYGPDGAIWLGGYGGITRYVDGKIINFSEAKELMNANTWINICCAADGVLWFGTENSWFGSGKGVFRYDGKTFRNLTTKDGLAHNSVMDVYQDSDGIMWFATADGISRYDGKKFTSLTTEYGLAHNWVRDIYQDSDGAMWFGTSVGVSRYDGKGFVNFTIEDGLAGQEVTEIYEGTDGAIWFGTLDAGVLCYDSGELINLTAMDGLIGGNIRKIYQHPDGTFWFVGRNGISQYDGKRFLNPDINNEIGDAVYYVCSDRDGKLWFTTRSSGIFQYDGQNFINFTTEDSLAGNWGDFVHCDPDGTLWFGTDGGVSRYDGESFANLTVEDGLKHNVVQVIYRNSDDVMWIATDGGISLYDGKKFFKSFTVADGLPDNDVHTISRDSDGMLWLGSEAGVSRYDGKTFVNFSVKDGISHADVRSSYYDTDGILWFGTYGGGVSIYDGTAWTSLDTREGLAGDDVFAIQQDPDGYMWFGTSSGVTRYRRGDTRPKAQIASVIAGEHCYTDFKEMPCSVVDTRVTIEYSSIDFRTLPEKRQYRCRIEGVDSNWRMPTKATLFDYTFKRKGTYKFQVQAIGRDLRYSEIASVPISVSALPLHRAGIFMAILSIVGGASLITVAILTAHHMRESRAERLRLQQELEDARQMQTRLLPENAPTIGGFDIAGFSRPAREVGGDFFNYLSLANGKFGFALADVSGKGLKAAMNAVLASGMLNTEAERIGGTCGQILSALNASLYPQIGKQMFTSLGLASIDLNGKKLQWANAAQPYPLIRRGAEVFEFKNDGELPLGMMPNMIYRDWEWELQTGDVIIFCTDGVIEAESEFQEMYGAERLEKFMADIDPQMSSDNIIKAVLQDIKIFAGNAEQYDDITVIVVKKGN